MFVAINACLSRQCFVATKMILVVGPANATPPAATRVVKGSYSGRSLRGKQTAFQDGVKSKCLDAPSTMNTMNVLQP